MNSDHGNDLASQLERATAAIVNGERVSVAYVLRHAQRIEELDFVDDAISSVLITQAIERERIVAEPEEVQRLAEIFRAGNELESEEAFQAWLDERHMSREAFEANIRKNMEFGKLKGHLTTDLDRMFEMLEADNHVLSSPTKSGIRDSLFLEWLENQRKQATIDVPLLKAL